jgi:hypothetical protein
MVAAVVHRGADVATRALLTYCRGRHQHLRALVLGRSTDGSLQQRAPTQP